MRAQQARLLVRPLLRTLPLAPLAAAGVCGLLVLSLEGDLLLRLRAAGVALCLAAAFALDDPAAETTATSPTPLLVRRLLRLALVLALVAAVWTPLLAYVGNAPRAALTLELAAMLAFALAASALALGVVRDGRGGLAGGPALLVFLAAAALALPDRWTLFASAPDAAGWAASHGRWALVLALGLLVLFHASLDPGRRRLLPRLLARDAEPAPAAEATERA